MVAAKVLLFGMLLAVGAWPGTNDLPGPANLIENGTFGQGEDGWTISGPGTVMTDSTGHFIRYKVPGIGGAPWDIALSQDFGVALPAKPTIKLEFEARAQRGSKLPGNPKFDAYIELSEPPYTKHVSSRITPGDDWCKFTLESPTTYDPAEGSLRVAFHLALESGTIDIRNVVVTSPQAPPAPVRSFPESLLPGDASRLIAGGSNPPKVTKGPGSIRAEFNNPGDPWETSIEAKVGDPVRARDVIVMTCEVRGTSTRPVTAIYELAEPPHGKDLSQAFAVDGTWRPLSFPFRAARMYDAGKSQFKFFLSGNGWVEVRNLELINYGRTRPLRDFKFLSGSPLYKREAAWVDEANERIEKLRKGRMVIQVTQRGKPVSNAQVTLTQTRHQFRFGTAVPASMLIADSPDAEKFRAVVSRLFNTVTFESDLKWRDTVGDIFESPINPATKWLQERGMELRGHNLVWGSRQFLPERINNLSKEETWAAVKAHVTDYVSKMKGKVYTWDGVNEAVTETELWDRIGWDKFGEVYKIARKIDPHARLAYNDYNITTNAKHREGAINRVKQLQAMGAPVDTFGDQSHLDGGGVNPRELWRVWDEVAQKTGLPLEVTEFDFSNFDDGTHAAYCEDFVRAAFAHPKIESMILWGFWERAHWLAERGGHFIHADWTWRPAMTALDRLINRDWRSNLTERTAVDGRVRPRVFYGDYTVRVGDVTKKIRFTRDLQVVKIELP